MRVLLAFDGSAGAAKAVSLALTNRLAVGFRQTVGAYVSHRHTTLQDVR